MPGYIIAAQQNITADGHAIVGARHHAVNRRRIKRPHCNIPAVLLAQFVAPAVGIIKAFAGLAELDTRWLDSAITGLRRRTTTQKSQGQENLLIFNMRTPFALGDAVKVWLNSKRAALNPD